MPLANNPVMEKKVAVQVDAILDSVVGHIVADTHAKVRRRMFAGKYFHIQSSEPIDNEYKKPVRPTIRLIREEQGAPELSYCLDIIKCNYPLPLHNPAPISLSQTIEFNRHRKRPEAMNR
jgi:hypothetical protein